MSSTKDWIRISALIVLALLAMPGYGVAAGFDEFSIPDGGSSPLTIYLWYPSSSVASPLWEGPFVQNVARQGRLSPGTHRLIVFSHGTGGTPLNHRDLALALADSGFVVAAPLHTGDNYRDHTAASYVRDIVDRPRHLRETIDYMLQTWPGHSTLAPDHAGIFGFSLGGLAALTLAGGEPNFENLRQLCRTHPRAPECLFVQRAHGDQLSPNLPHTAWTHDPRVGAVVVAAPAVSLLLDELDHVHAPVQMWRAEADENVPDSYNTARIREQLRSPLEEHVVPKAGHFVFVAPCTDDLARQAPSLCSDPAGVNRIVFHEQFDSAVVAFFRRALRH